VYSLLYGPSGAANLEADVDGTAANGNNTIEVVVFAANRLSNAVASGTKTQERNRGASDTDLHGGALDDSA